MTIALDFDGTFDRDPKFWRLFVDTSRHFGHEVLIVSCRQDEGENRTAMMEMTQLPLWRHKLTSGEAKRHYMERTGWKIDVWIDDEPKNIENGK